MAVVGLVVGWGGLLLGSSSLTGILCWVFGKKVSRVWWVSW